MNEQSRIERALEAYRAAQDAGGSLFACVTAALNTAPWVDIEERRPERNAQVVYWHKDDAGGFPAIADEWRDEHHLDSASHWLDIGPPPCDRGHVGECEAFAPQTSAPMNYAGPRNRALEPDDGA